MEILVMIFYFIVSLILILVNKKEGKDVYN